MQSAASRRSPASRHAVRPGPALAVISAALAAAALSGCVSVSVPSPVDALVPFASSEAVPVPPGLAFRAGYPATLRPASGVAPPGEGGSSPAGFPYRVDVASGTDPATGEDIELYVVADDFGWLERELLDARGPQAYWEQVSETFAGVAGGTSLGATALDVRGLDAGEVSYHVPAGEPGTRQGARLFLKRYLVRGELLACATCSVPLPGGAGGAAPPSPESVPAASAVCRPFLDSLEILD
ncbi:MAG: hypothetical protein LBT40_03765 [Deltaproteobacteria bacterium]|nr:hypothetical protein [Deltaproteobacteria bacterium]